jgi:uncharacterized protein YcaQ
MGVSGAMLQRAPISVSNAQARQLWLRAQRLDERAPFGGGPQATRAAVEHLGYVQIDTINVIERCHHHILYSRIPEYQRSDLHQAQAADKSIFEYWTHALSYVPTCDLRFFIPAMRQNWDSRFPSVTTAELRKLLKRIEREGALTIRDIEDDDLVEKDHPWASRKPAKRALELAFYKGLLTINARSGMLKSYELANRHFGWDRPPKAASEAEVLKYMLDRALRTQGLVSLDSICHLDASRKAPMKLEIEARVKRGTLLSVALEGAGRVEHWAKPAALETTTEPAKDLVHILSPFDPLIIQRKRLSLVFGYDHRFEAYVPKAKRLFGYFALPVLIGDQIVAAIDLKTDRSRKQLSIQHWTWVGGGQSKSRKRKIEEELHRFERFQLGS